MNFCQKRPYDRIRIYLLPRFSIPSEGNYVLSRICDWNQFQVWSCVFLFRTSLQRFQKTDCSRAHEYSSIALAMVASYSNSKSRYSSDYSECLVTSLFVRTIFLRKYFVDRGVNTLSIVTVGYLRNFLVLTQIRRSLPDVLLAMMNILYNQYKKVR